MTRVLGTRIVHLPEEPPSAIVLSDLHVPADGGRVVEWLEGALRAARERGAHVFVLGDLFDSYVSAAQVRTGIWREVAGRFAAAAEDGVCSHLVVGNRDFLLGPEFAAAARLQLVHGGLRVRLGGTDTLLLHGDELCVADLPYQKAKWWLRQPLVRWIARRLPLGVAIRVAERARRRSRRVVQSGDPSRFLPTRSALVEALSSGSPQLIFGHIHRHASGSLGSGRYWVLPAFDSDPIVLLADAQGIAPMRAGPDGRLHPQGMPGELPLPG